MGEREETIAKRAEGLAAKKGSSGEVEGEEAEEGDKEEGEAEEEESAAVATVGGMVFAGEEKAADAKARAVKVLNFLPGEAAIKASERAAPVEREARA